MHELELKDIIRQSNKKSLFGALIVIFFFVTITLGFYYALYSSIEENIALHGELKAAEAADKFDRYLNSSSKLLMLEKSMLDQMLADGASHQEIQTYLTEETDRIHETIDSGYTGLYGYILGRYHDGANWVPDEDYVPTKRPWYVDAITEGGGLAVVQPYLDAQTGLIVTTLSSTLADRNSVIALDISFAMIKSVTEEDASSGDLTIQIILDDKGMVVAHSIVDEIGHDYSQETGTMGAEILKKIETDNEEYFHLNYGGVKYLVYVDPISNGWYSISVTDTTKSYSGLNRSVIMAIIVIVAIIMILSTVFLRSNQRNILAQRLNKQLATSANIYMSVVYVDIIKDKCERIKSSKAAADLKSESARWGAQKTFRRVLGTISDNPTKDKLMTFVDLSTLDERFTDTDDISMEFIGYNDKWCRGRFIVADRTADGHVAHVLWLLEDIDEEKKRREDLIDMSDRAIAASEAKSAFLSNMSHEIRTPINAMLGLNEMILRECDDSDILSYSTGINTAGQTLLGIVNDILDFSKIEAGKMEIIPVEYSLASMLNDLVNMVHTRADAKGLTLDVKVDSHIPDSLYGDEIRIKQAITNILTNSVKYTEKGGVTFSLEYERMTDRTIILKVSVTDTGIGIKEEDMSKLFSEFDRIDEKKNRHIEGTGLGMAITQSLLKMMGSTLNVKSKYGEGSTFSFNLVQTVVDQREIGDYESTYKETSAKRLAYKEKFIAPEARVLVVDDTPLNLTVFTSLLKKTQVQIDAVESGDEAIRYACAQKYDTIFLDHMMPGKDGIETLHELSETENNRNKETPVICLTANAISGMREKYLAEGFDDYLSKPIDSEKLEEMLMKYIPKDKILESSVNSEDIASDTDEESAEEIPPQFLEIPGLDPAKAVLKCGSVSVYLDILASFCKGIDGFVVDAKEYIAAGNTKDASIKIHAIKSQLRTVGAYDLGELAESLEMAAKNEDTGLLKKDKDELFNRCKALRSAIKAGLDATKTDEADLPEISPEKLEEIFAELVRCAEEFDLYNIDETAAELKKVRIPEEYADKVDKVLELVESMDYDQIPEVLG